MKKAILHFSNIKLNPSQTHKFRGYVGNVFSEYDLIHNHDSITGKHIYRYPLIQFKIINNTPYIVALTGKAVKIFTEIFMNMDKINIEGRVIPVHEKDLKIETVEFGFSQETFMYEFLTPWISLNQRNHTTYVELDSKNKKEELLKRIITGNILSMSKDLGTYLDRNQRIHINTDFKEKTATLKNKKMLCFSGIFKSNFIIPDHAGIGKSVSRGFGTVKRLL